MTVRIISKFRLPGFINQLIKNRYQLITPVKVEDFSLFKKINSADEIYLDELLTKLPVKEIFFPRTQPLFSFQLHKKDIELSAIEKDGYHSVIFGTRPCDASSLVILDKVFRWDYQDELYLERRENTTIISISCESPADSCFCSSMNLTPQSTIGSDILFTLVDDERYLVEIVTEKGGKLVQECNILFDEATETDEIKKQKIYEQSQSEIIRHIDTAKTKQWLDYNFEHELWSSVSRKCLGCAACTYSCPTCHCFDIVDESDYRQGIRIRNWDTCSFSNFTLMPAHQPRGTQDKRFRQRVMHKFKYYVDRFDTPACVGCGRCIRICPVTLDIIEIITVLTD